MKLKCEIQEFQYSCDVTEIYVFFPPRYTNFKREPLSPDVHIDLPDTVAFLILMNPLLAGSCFKTTISLYTLIRRAECTFASKLTKRECFFSTV